MLKNCKKNINNIKINNLILMLKKYHNGYHLRQKVWHDQMKLKLLDYAVVALVEGW